jgi:hypothetical protein
VIRHDPDNPRGRACWIKGFDGGGRDLFVSVGYADRPVTLITAYYLTPPELKDGDGDEEEAEETNSGL